MNDPRSQAQGLAQYGRHGDSMLMHVNPNELQGLQSLAQANGTSLTTNPYTGQPESFNMGQFLKMAAPVAAGFAFGGPMGGAMGLEAASASAMGGLAAGALTGAGIAAFTGDNVLMGGLTGAMGGYGGGSMAGAAGTVGAGAGNTVAAKNLGTDLAADRLTSQMANQATNWGGQASKMAPEVYADTLSKSVGAPTSQLMRTGGGQGIRGGFSNLPSYQTTPHMVSNYGQAAATPSNLNTLVSNPGAVAKQMGGGNALLGGGKMALTAGMPLLAGMEPPNYGASEGEFEPPYDPNSQLDLSMDTGLRLLANGGDVSSDPRISRPVMPGPEIRRRRLEAWKEREAAIQELIEQRKIRGKWPNKKTKTQEDPRINRLANGGDVGLGEGEGAGDFIAGNFAAGDFAEGDNFGDFAEVTEAGQFNDFNEFNDFANDPLLQEPGGFNDPLLQEPGGFNTAVNQPLPPQQNSFNNPPAAGRFIEGSGDGLSDSIPASIEGEQEARLSDGEFVVPADVVSGIGNGSSDAGSAQLFNMMKNIRKRRTGMTTQPKEIRPTDMSI